MTGPKYDLDKLHDEELNVKRVSWSVYSLTSTSPPQWRHL